MSAITIQQSYEGIVLSVDREKQEFTVLAKEARVSTYEEMTLPLAMLSREQEELLEEGKALLWYIGYKTVIVPYEEVRVLCKKLLTEIELAEARKRGRSLLATLDGHSGTQAGCPTPDSQKENGSQ